MASNESRSNWYHKGIQLQRKKQLKQAIDCYHRALDDTPQQAEIYGNLGAAYAALGHDTAAELAYRKGLQLDEKKPILWSNFGNLLCRQKRFTEAEAAHSHALTLQPEDDGIWYNAGNVPFYSNKPRLAIERFDNCLRLNPKNAKAHWNRSLAYLQMGEWQRGFKEYEWRFQVHPEVQTNISSPRWQGQSLKNKSLLLVTEQGFGDIIQFARFIPWLQEYGIGKIYLECRDQLVGLLDSLPNIDAVIERGKPVPEHDFHFPLLSLAHLFLDQGKSLIAETPYIQSSESSHQEIVLQKRKLANDKRLKVAINWSGKLTPYDRSCPLNYFNDLFAQHLDVHFISLQFGEQREQLYQEGLHYFVSDLGQYINNFNDTALLLDEIDLFISIDSAPAHLAAAMNRPTWLLLLEYNDWRWLIDTNQSPWYPSMQVFRQPQKDDWQSVIGEVSKALEKFKQR